MRWYKIWYLRINDTDHMKDITCRTEENTDVLMKDTDLEDMYCEAAPIEAEERREHGARLGQQCRMRFILSSVSTDFQETDSNC